MNIFEEHLREIEQKRRESTDVYVKAVTLLTRREHSAHELREKLQKFFGDDNAIEDVLERLMTEGLQSDTRFAESMIRYRASQGKGPVFIRDELRMKNVASPIIDEAFACSDEDWCARARVVRAKKFGEEVPSDFVSIAKQKRFLQQRGFSMQQNNDVFVE